MVLVTCTVMVPLPATTGGVETGEGMGTGPRVVVWRLGMRETPVTVTDGEGDGEGGMGVLVGTGGRRLVENRGRPGGRQSKRVVEVAMLGREVTVRTTVVVRSWV